MTRCKGRDCKKDASFGNTGGPRIFCGTHKLDGMINLKNKKCNESDCLTRPRYAQPGEYPIYCATHKKEGMINVTSKICIEKECKIQATFAKVGDPPKFCEAHKLDGMINVRVKICNEPDCKNQAVGGYLKCRTHKGGKRCIVSGCESGAESKTDRCVTHGGGKLCNETGCKSKAQGKTDKCVKHGGGNRCPNCIDWIDSRGGRSEYDGYCVTCFKRLFPDDERSKVVYGHTKEIRVRNAINDRFEGFIHDRPLYTGDCDCTHRRRIDHRKLIGNTILAIETDEFGHRDYDEKDEIIRYDDVYMIHSGKWIFIRFNPDGDKRVDMEDKLEKLLDTIEEQVERIENEENEELLEIIKLY